MEVSERFKTLLSNLTLTKSQFEDGQNAHQSVRRCLNSHYYSRNSWPENSRLIGSWGRDTQVRPPRDVDVLFVLPNSVWQRFQYATGNKQSQILQEVKRVLLNEFGRTDVKGDGPVVIVPFVAYSVEVCPAFHQWGERYNICLTTAGGSFKAFEPVSEIDHLRASNSATSGNTRDLVRMLKRWQEFCSVPLKSFWLELLAVEFLQSWEHRGKSTVYYDYLIRDFFSWLAQKGAWPYSNVAVPGTGEFIQIGNAWGSKAATARDRAIKATDFEAARKPYDAGGEWQKIFGTFIPTG